MPLAVRESFEWRLRARGLPLGARTRIMGILNITPDSFSDGGRFISPPEALDQALRMLDAGADILDLGGESTRPGATPIPPAEEQARILPVLKLILQAWPEAILSVDTYHSDTARAAIDAGAEIVNDVSGFLWDPEMATTCAQLRCGAVLMHTRGRPQEWRSQPRLQPEQVLPLVLEELQHRAEEALNAGISRESLVIDPGFGFGKVLDENYPLLAGLEALQQLQLPILVGLSRKSFLRRALAEKRSVQLPLSDNDLLPTCAANVAAILSGAHILRVHDVGPAVAVAAVADRLLGANRQSV